MEADRELTLKAAADLVGVPVRTLRRFIREGRVEVTTSTDEIPRVRVSALSRAGLLPSSSSDGGRHDHGADGAPAGEPVASLFPHAAPTPPPESVPARDAPSAEQAAPAEEPPPSRPHVVVEEPDAAEPAHEAPHDREDQDKRQHEERRKDETEAERLATLEREARERELEAAWEREAWAREREREAMREREAALLREREAALERERQALERQIEVARARERELDELQHAAAAPPGGGGLNLPARLDESMFTLAQAGDLFRHLISEREGSYSAWKERTEALYREMIEDQRARILRLEDRNREIAQQLADALKRVPKLLEVEAMEDVAKELKGQLEAASTKAKELEIERDRYKEAVRQLESDLSRSERRGRELGETLRRLKRRRFWDRVLDREPTESV